MPYGQGAIFNKLRTIINLKEIFKIDIPNMPATDTLAYCNRPMAYSKGPMPMAMAILGHMPMACHIGQGQCPMPYDIG